MLREIQKAHKEWADRNFGNVPAHQPVLGVAEELGELVEADDSPTQHIVELVKAIGRLSHAQLKSEQGIRMNENHEENAKDAVGDITMFLIDLCNCKGWDYQEIVQGTWEHISKRDWTK
jgi:NTP pyrophosphatase (non-canonical NTP hydrolase)